MLLYKNKWFLGILKFLNFDYEVLLILISMQVQYIVQLNALQKDVLQQKDERAVSVKRHSWF